jgi:predicted O-methyltransferase YrrM
MKSSPEIEIVDGVTFELRPHHRTPTRKDRICLRKNRNYTNRYLSIAQEFAECRMVEVGVDKGGSTSFFTKLLKPNKLVAFELSDKPVPKLTEFLAAHDLERRVEIHWGVDQSDPVVVPEILDQAFGNQPLDLVVDDASHMLIPSAASFEMIFPRLRDGGLYILEDWSGDHLLERRLRAAFDTEPEGKAMEQFSAAVAKVKQRTTPMSVLICQLVIASAYHPDWISDIRLSDGFCEVRRGPGEILPKTPLTQYFGTLGEWIFEKRLD